jgi:CBS domain containing-hemolysin-like protein
MAFEIIIILCSLILSAFFSGMEIAYVSANKIHVEIEKKQNDFLARILTRRTRKPSKFIATMLVGNNIALVIYGFFMGDLLMKWLAPGNFSNEIVVYLLTDLSLLTQTIISTLIILLTAEFLPKYFSRYMPTFF